MMNWSVTLTVPVLATRPASLRPRSSSIRCSARSLGSASRSAASASSSAPGGAALARAGDRAHGDGALAAFEAHQDLGRGADHMEILEVEIEHVGRGVQRAQRAVERHRAGGEGLAHALREHHLHDVAIDDVLLGAPHGGLEGLLAEFRRRPARRTRTSSGNAHRFAQLAEQFLEPRLGLLPGAGKTGLGIDHQGQLAGEVVDDGDFFGQQQQDVGHAEASGFRARARRLVSM
jgi:hypothetical protein